jgi:hypothetical protein
MWPPGSARTRNWHPLAPGWQCCPPTRERHSLAPSACSMPGPVPLANAKPSNAVRNPGDVSRLRSRLTELGIDPDAPSTPVMITPTEASLGTPIPRKIRLSPDQWARIYNGLAALLIFLAFLAALALIALVRATSP